MQFFKFSIAFLALFILVCSAEATPKETYLPARNINELSELMPMSALPSPRGLELKYIVLGIGTQNYTCEGREKNKSPTALGAVAQLYDIGSGLNKSPHAKRITRFISPLILSLRHQPIHLYYVLKSYGFQYLIGHHFFDQDIPIFALDQLGQAPYPIAKVQKLYEAEAPISSFLGQETEASLKWLFLKDSMNVSQGGIDTVYRIETAGGIKPASCRYQESYFEVHYVAQYWIFGQ